MRGPSKKTPAYRKHKRSGRAVVTLNGRDYYLGPYGSKASKLEYDRIIAEWLANGRRATDAPETLLVSELIAAYWRWCKTWYVKNGRPTDELGCIKMALRHTRALYGRVPVTEFGPKSLKAVRQLMVERGNCRRYVNGNTKRIRRMFKWGVAEELVPPEVYQALTTVESLRLGKTTARESEPVLPVTDEVVEATLPFCKPMVRDMIQFQRLTGCRPGEVQSMRPCEIDCSEPVWRYTPGSHKMEHKGRRRVILIGPRAQAILKPYLALESDQVCFEGPRGGMQRRFYYIRHIYDACDKAFPAPEGTEGEALKNWQKAHRWAPNRLRHSCATEIRQQFGLEASQCVLGHASADVTQIYAERDLERAANIMAQVG